MTDFIFLVSIITEDSNCRRDIKRHLLLRSKATTNIDSVLESRDTISPTKVRIVKVMVFPVVTYRFENRPIRRLRNWCLWIVVLEKTLESPVDCKEIKPVYPKGNQTWIVSGRTDAEAEAPILWPADVKNLLIGKTLMQGKIEGKRRWAWWNMRWLDKWRTGEPGMLQSTRYQRLKHDSATWKLLEMHLENGTCSVNVSYCCSCHYYYYYYDYF